MERGTLANSPAGRMVRIENDAWSFIPNDLPPPIDYTPDLVVALSEGERSLGGVKHLARFIPNPSLLVVPFLTVEAKLSSQIEGTQTTVDEVLRGLSRDAGLSDDGRLVRNYLRAMKLGMARLESLPLSWRLVREAHQTLLSGVRGQDSIPGEFRRVQVHIGRRDRTVRDAIYVPPPPQHLPALCDNWERFLHAPKTMPPLVECALMHAQFEMIHPFMDGNGRMGRLLISLFLMSRDLLPQPLLYLSAYLERHRQEYFDRLLAISLSGDWEGWVMFLCRAVARQAEYAVRSASTMIDLRQETWDMLQRRRNPQTALRLLDLLFETPYVSVSDVQRALDVSYPTASAAVARLVDTGFLDEITGGKYGRIYCATKLVAAIRAAEAPPPDAAPEQQQLPFR